MPRTNLNALTTRSINPTEGKDFIQYRKHHTGQQREETIRYERWRSYETVNCNCIGGSCSARRRCDGLEQDPAGHNLCRGPASPNAVRRHHAPGGVRGGECDRWTL